MMKDENAEGRPGSLQCQATILTIGDELSRGEIGDSNAAFLCS